MDAHEVAKLIVAKIEDTEKMPDLDGGGLCRLLSRHGSIKGFHQTDFSVGRYFSSFLPKRGFGYLPNRGEWTELRMNLLALMACTTAEDFKE